MSAVPHSLAACPGALLECAQDFAPGHVWGRLYDFGFTFSIVLMGRLIINRIVALESSFHGNFRSSVLTGVAILLCVTDYWFYLDVFQLHFLSLNCPAFAHLQLRIFQ